MPHSITVNSLGKGQILGIPSKRVKMGERACCHVICISTHMIDVTEEPRISLKIGKPNALYCTLRLKAMEKESLTSKLLFNRCYIFFILVQCTLVSVQSMKRFRSLPLITFKIP